jgi:hypothetical protein
MTDQDVPPSIFLGLITHPRTRFSDASGSTGLLHQLSSALTERSCKTQIGIVDQDLIDPGDLDLSQGALRASINAEFSLESLWQTYLNPNIHNQAKPLILRSRRLLQFIRLKAWGRSDAPASKRGRNRLIRLANIEAAHLAAMELSCASGCDWALVLEDDATSQDIPTLAEALISHLSDWERLEQPVYVNMSESFSLSSLGIDHLVARHSLWDQTAEVLSTSRPVTNTVCAILYRSSFLADLLTTLRDIPMQPIIPIDWKLNAALMQLVQEGSIGDGDCFTLEPAPIRQSSMH